MRDLIEGLVFIISLSLIIVFGYYVLYLLIKSEEPTSEVVITYKNNTIMINGEETEYTLKEVSKDKYLIVKKGSEK